MMEIPMSEAKRHFKITLKVRYRTKNKVKHTLEKPGVWPFNRKKRGGTTTTQLECDDCVIRVAEVNLDEVVSMMNEDPSFKQLIGFYSEAMGDYGCFPENWDDTEWLNTCGMEGDFIHDSFEGASEEYRLWNTEEVREEHFENLRDWDEEAIEPARRVMNFEESLDDGEVDPPWTVTYSKPWGGWASGAFYPDFPVILIDNVELMEIRTVTEQEMSESSDQSEDVISLEEFKTLA
jgi:hypothetical protein